MTDWTELCRGIVLGIVLVVALQAFVIYRIFIYIPHNRIIPPTTNNPKRDQDGDAHPENLLPWPVPIQNLIRETQSQGPASELTQTQNCDWLNVLLHRIFLSVRRSSVFRKKWSSQVAKKLNAKLVGNSFISRIEITDLLLGDHCPLLDGLRVSKTVTDDLAVMADADITYKGGASLKLTVVASNNTLIPIHVFCSEFRGTVRIRLPHERFDDMLSVSFIRDPGLNFRVDADITVQKNEYLRNMVNGALSTLMRRVFLDVYDG